jgi:hypothetical protein
MREWAVKLEAKPKCVVVSSTRVACTTVARAHEARAVWRTVCCSFAIMSARVPDGP